jgi:hypothetical protein
MREIGVLIPDHTIIESSQLADRKEVAQEVKKIQGLAAPTPEEVQRAQMLDELQMRLLNAEVMEKEAHAMERQAKAQQLQAQGQAQLAQPQLEAAKLQIDAQLRNQEQQISYQSNFEDLMTRLELMKMKTGSAERVASAQSATKRMEGALSRQSQLETALISARNKQNESKGTQKA